MARVETSMNKSAARRRRHEDEGAKKAYEAYLRRLELLGSWGGLDTDKREAWRAATRAARSEPVFVGADLALLTDLCNTLLPKLQAEIEYHANSGFVLANLEAMREAAEGDAETRILRDAIDLIGDIYGRNPRTVEAP